MIRCAGVPGLLPDAGGELSRFLDRYLPLQDLLFSVESPARHELGIVSHTKNGQDGIVLPFPDPLWPCSPKPRLNTLYWPTGASRWAHCLLLVDTDGKEEIVAAAHDNGRANVVTLEMSTGNVTVEQNGWGRDGQDVGLSVDMYVLKPRPVSITQTPEARHLWLVPLVDERYLWQWKPVGTLSTADIPDWEALLQVVADAIGEDLIGNVVVPGSEFNWKPDIEGRTALDHMNAAILLDAVAQSFGRRVVRQLDGDLQVLAATQGTTNWDNSYRSARDTPEEVWYRLAGEEFHDEPGGAGVPEEFVVLFHSTGETATIRAEDVDGTEWTPGFSRLFRVPYTPDNFSAEARTDLAESLARAYYTWQQRQGSLTFAGVKAWKFGGCEDDLTITLGDLHQGEYLAQTHVRSLPPNFGIRSLVSSGEVSGAGCRDVIRLVISGAPINGAAQLVLNRVPTDTEDPFFVVDLPWDSTAAEVKALIESSPDWSENWVVSASFGPFPNASILLSFTGVSVSDLLNNPVGNDDPELQVGARFQPHTLEGGARVYTRIEASGGL